ncbi:hypothetical protein BGZ94_006796 [Podila epigama]|nr:hypothetical protein BGZ94_006796 [Podila epigama]
MSIRNLREQFKGNGGSNLAVSSGISILTGASGLSSAGTPDGSAPSLLSRRGSLLRSSSHGNLRRSKSQHKKGPNGAGHQDNYGDLTMEMTLVIVKRCVKEIRLRGLTTKNILRQVQMAQSQRVVLDTIRIILDDDANTELSALRQVDIHLVAHAMKWAIRYSEETLVTYADYQTLYLDQDKSFSRFVNDLPPTNRAILLDLFSLCADITLLEHLNNMNLVAVAKAISLSIMAEPEREFTTFDASLQQRNIWGAACEDLLRAFLRIKRTHDLAKIELEDEVDENRYVDNITRVVKSARQRSNEDGAMPNISVPSSASSSGWPSAMTPSGYGRAPNGYFDQILTPRSASPLSQQSGSINGSTLSRSHSLAKSNSSLSRPISPAPYGDDHLEYEELMRDQSHLGRLRHTSRHSRSLRPAELDRRRSSAGIESLQMLPVDSTASMDGYGSEPEDFHAASIIPDFADGLGWDFTKIADLQQADDPPSLTHETRSSDKGGVNRFNSSSSNGSSSSSRGSNTLNNPSPSSFRDSSKLPTHRVHPMQDQQYLLGGHPSNSLQRAHSQQDLSSSYRDSDTNSPPSASVHRSSTNVNKTFVVGRNSPSTSPRRGKRNSVLRRSVSLDPHSMQARLQMKSNDLRQDALIRELSIQDGLSPTSAFSLESSPQDLERPAIPTRSASQGLGRSMSKTAGPSGKLEISVGGLPTGASSELTPVSNPPSNSSSIVSPRPQLPLASDASQNSGRTFEVISRPKEIEVNVLFTPITPVSPKAEMRSKFQESFSDRPMSPPPGYASNQASSSKHRQHNRSPTSGSNKSGKVSPSSSKMSPPRQRKAGNRSASSPKRKSAEQQQLQQLQQLQQQQQQHLLQQQQLAAQSRQQVAQSSSSISSSSSNAPEAKSKAAGFIRALSHKLRSKQSDDQLRPVRINNQIVGSVAVAPAVSIQPPRLELSFLGDLGSSASTTSTTKDEEAKAGHAFEENLPPASAPASLVYNGTNIALSSTGPVESWRKMAQDSLPIPTPGSGELGPSNQEAFSPPLGFTGARRSSGTLFGSGSIAHREQRRRSKNFVVGSTSSVPRLSPLSHQQVIAKSDGNARPAVLRPSRLRKERRTSSDSSYTTDEDSVTKTITTPAATTAAASPASKETMSATASSSEQPSSLSSSQATANSPTDPKKTRGGYREYRFSTATLLKDGKLYYQLQWDSFSEMGFKSDFFNEPEQYLSGLSQKRMSRMGPPAPAVTDSTSSPVKGSDATATVTSQTQPGQSSIGHRRQAQDPGPSPEQRLAAMKAARESFMALAKDPKALAALKAGSTGGIGQATIIGTGSFPIGSAQPVLQGPPPNLNWSTAPSSAQAAKASTKTLDSTPKNPYPSPAPSPGAHSHQKEQDTNNAKPLEASTLSAVHSANANLQATVSGKSLPTLSSNPTTLSTTATPLQGMAKGMSSGNIAAGAGGAASSSFSPTKPVKGQSLAPAPAAKPTQKSRLFGSKFRSSKKSHRVSVTLSPNAATNYYTNNNNSSKMDSSKKRLLPVGVTRKDVLTKTEESLDEVFPWMTVEHMTGQESGWVMLEPVQDGAVGWVKIDKLEEEMAKYAKAEKERQQD